MKTRKQRSKAAILAELDRVSCEAVEQADGLLNELSTTLDPGQQESFRNVFDKFEISSDFLIYWKNSDDCKAAFRKLCEATANNLEMVAKLMRELSA